MKPHTPTLFLMLLGATALGQGTQPLTLSLSQALVRTITENGKNVERLLPAPKDKQMQARPGDVAAQLLAVRNTAGRDLTGVAVQLPVPRNMVYLAAEKPAGVRTQYSIDGGKTFASAPLKKKVTVTENGKAVEREVEVRPSEYQAVRWTIGTLPAGAERKLGFRVQVK